MKRAQQLDPLSLVISATLGDGLRLARRYDEAIEQVRKALEMDPSFANFMERFGDFFPGAENLEDVLRQMAENAQAAEAMFNSLSPEQQATLRSTFSSMLTVHTARAWTTLGR